MRENQQHLRDETEMLQLKISDVDLEIGFFDTKKGSSAMELQNELDKAR